MEINKWIPDCVSEKILTSFQKRILRKLYEPTTNRADLHEVLKMSFLSTPYGDSTAEDETSFTAHVDGYDIFSSELSDTIKNDFLSPVPKNEKPQTRITSSAFSVSEVEPNLLDQSNEKKSSVVREKRVKIKIILPKRHQYSPLFSQNNYRRKSTTDDSVGKIVEELVLEKYKHFFEYYENKKNKRNNKKRPFVHDQIDENVHDTMSKSMDEICDPKNFEDNERIRYSNSVENLDHLYSSPKLSHDCSVSVREISDLLTSDNSLSPCPTYTSIPVLNNDEEDGHHELTDIDKNSSSKTAIQNRIINQISTVIQFCKLNKNIQGYVEAERLLLLANYEKNFNSKIDNRSSDFSSAGIVTILNVSFSAEEQDLFFVTAPSKIYYVCLFVYNKCIVSSGTSISDQDGKIRFDKEITIKNLPPDFVVEASLYALRLPQCFQFRDKYNFLSPHQKHIGPRRLFVPRSGHLKDETNLKSSFCLVGRFDLTIQDVGSLKHVGIRNMIPEFVILSQGKLEMKCDVLDSGHPIFSFVDLGFRVGKNPIRWNRLWGSIGKMDLNFWKYPDDNPECPVVTIDLRSCLDKKVTNADLETCLRPRTLQLEVEEPNGVGIYNRIVFLISFDSIDDMIEWKNQLNSLIPWIKKM